MTTSPYRMDMHHIKELISMHDIGGILFLGNCIAYDVSVTAAHFQSLSKEPLIIALDAEWPAMRLHNLPIELKLPHHITLGALSDPTLVEEYGYLVGLLLQKLGVQMNLAPVADVNNNPDNPVINIRSFGAYPERVARMVVAYIHGLERAQVASCAKHFPGHGDTNTDSHFALPVMFHDRERLDAIELVPFRAAISADVPAIMTAHIQMPKFESNPNIPATLSANIITHLLRKELGFDGIIMTDGIGMKGICDHHQPGELEVKALEAGVDMLLCPANKRMPIPDIIAYIVRAIETGRLAQADIDAKVLRVLRMKEKYVIQKTNLPEWPELLEQTKKLKKEIYKNAVTIAYNHFDKPSDADQVISLIGMNKLKHQQFGILPETLKLIKKLHNEGKKITVVLYGSPYAVELIKEYADCVIIAYDDDPDAHDAVTAILEGRMAARGTMPI
jgi:beta-N-acetylhexosaminidase